MQRVIKSSPCDYKELSGILRGILSDLHYATHECCACGWIDHEDEKWGRCARCDDYICSECQVDGEGDMVCEACADANKDDRQ